MGSNKVFVFMGFLLALVLLITSDVAARDLAQTENAETNGVNEAKYPGNGYGNGGYPGNGGGNYGGGNHGGYYGGGRRNNRGGSQRGYCRYGCCDRGRGGYYNRQRGCSYCCHYAGQAADLGNKN